jgi:hypothetical protein
MRQALIKEENRILNFKIKIATLLMIVLSVYTVIQIIFTIYWKIKVG